MTSLTREQISVASSDWSAGTWLADLRAHGTLYSVALLTYVASIVQSYWLGMPLRFSAMAFISMTALQMVLLVVLVQLLIELARLWRQGASVRPLPALTRKLFDDILTPRRVSNGFHALFATGIFSAGFIAIKSNIPVAAPFQWDEYLMQFDRILHFGVLPHDLLKPLYQSPATVSAINLIYHIWFLVLAGFFVWQGLCKMNSPLRQRYLLAYMLTWGIGTLLLGTIFSSVGPCFYGYVVPGPDPYKGIMDSLESVNADYPVWALSIQDILWTTYRDSGGTVSAISALPSMHVASSVLFLLCAYAAGIRWLTWICGFFAVAVFIGSIVLGWHYAVDGYVGALVALACWKAAGWWVNRTIVSSRPS